MNISSEETKSYSEDNLIVRLILSACLIVAVYITPQPLLILLLFLISFVIQPLMLIIQARYKPIVKTALYSAFGLYISTIGSLIYAQQNSDVESLSTTEVSSLRTSFNASHRLAEVLDQSKDAPLLETSRLRAKIADAQESIKSLNFLRAFLTAFFPCTTASIAIPIALFFIGSYKSKSTAIQNRRKKIVYNVD